MFVYTIELNREKKNVGERSSVKEMKTFFHSWIMSDEMRESKRENLESHAIVVTFSVVYFFNNWRKMYANDM